MDILRKDWSAALTIEKLLISLCSILMDRGLEDPLVPEEAQMYLEDNEAYNEAARLYTERYATGERPDLFIT